MIDIVSQYRLGLIEKDSRLFRASTAVDDLLQQICIVAARGFDEELTGRGTLWKWRLVYIFVVQSK
jgi:hypothetical protein